MGTDIHVQAERREAGRWVFLPMQDLPCDNDLCDGGVYSDETPNEKMRGTACYYCDGAGHYVRPFYSNRNYNVFAILADVRNGVGFAGLDTGDGFVPIDSPRGLPDDLSPEIREMVEDESDDEERFYMGDHSFSFVTVAELLAYNWDRTTKLRGWVDAWNFELWRRNGQPSSWSGGISGQQIEHVSNETVARMIDGGDIVFEGEDEDWLDRTGFNERPYTIAMQRALQGVGLPEGSVGAQIAAPAGIRYYTLVEWERSYRECAADFLEILHRDLVPLGAPDDVRLVFGFDS